MTQGVVVCIHERGASQELKHICRCPSGSRLSSLTDTLWIKRNVLDGGLGLQGLIPLSVIEREKGWAMLESEGGPVGTFERIW